MASQHGSTSGSTVFDDFSCEYSEHRLNEQQQSMITGEGSSAPLGNTIDAWRNLADPNVQFRADGLGTGRLHRLGKNFKPADDELFPQHETTDTSVNGSMRTIAENRSQQQRPIKQPRTPTHRRVEDLSHRPSTPGGWGSGQLSVVPFWEQQQQQATAAAAAAKPTNTTTTTTTTITIPLSTVSSTLVSPTYVYTPSPEPPSPKPLLEFHVALVPGVAITFTMHEGDDAADVTERVMREHRLTVDTEVKRKMSNTLQLLYHAKMNKGSTITVN